MWIRLVRADPTTIIPIKEADTQIFLRSPPACIARVSILVLFKGDISALSNSLISQLENPNYGAFSRKSLLSFQRHSKGSFVIVSIGILERNTITLKIGDLTLAAAKLDFRGFGLLSVWILSLDTSPRKNDNPRCWPVSRNYDGILKGMLTIEQKTSKYIVFKVNADDLALHIGTAMSSSCTIPASRCSAVSSAETTKN